MRIISVWTRPHPCRFSWLSLPRRSDRYESRIYRSGESRIFPWKILKENGVEITGYFSKSPESAKSAADFTNTKLYKSIENILSDSDTCLYCAWWTDKQSMGLYEESGIIKNKIFVIAAVRFHQPFFWWWKPRCKYLFGTSPICNKW